MVILFVPGLGGGISGRGVVNKNKIKQPPQHTNLKLQHIQKLTSKMKGREEGKERGR